MSQLEIGKYKGLNLHDKLSYLNFLSFQEVEPEVFYTYIREAGSHVVREGGLVRYSAEDSLLQSLIRRWCSDRECMVYISELIRYRS